MPLPRQHPAPSSRITVRTATARVQAEMEVRGVGNKQIGDLIGVSEGQVSHKVRMTGRSTFSVDELGAIGEHWAKSFGAPHGWPFLDWAYARLLQDQAEELQELRKEKDQRSRTTGREGA